MTAAVARIFLIILNIVAVTGGRITTTTSSRQQDVNNTTSGLGVEDFTAVCTYLSAVSLDCSNRTLSSVPANLPADIQSLHLTNNNITNVGSDDLKFMSNLRFVDLRQNSLSSVAEDVFVNCSVLCVLDVSSNLLISLDFVNSVPTLVNLYASSNNITSISNHFNMSYLEYLDLSSNYLVTLPLTLTSQLPAIQLLNLSHNFLEAFYVESTAWNRLTRLDLSHNRIRQFMMCPTCYLRGLQWLDLSHNQLVSVASDWFPMLPQLVWFDASCNEICDLIDQTFSAASQLQTLSLTHLSCLRTLGPNVFTGLGKLQHLYLSHNPQLSTIHNNAFHSLSNISLIDLSSNNLQWMQFQFPTSFDSVRLAENPWNCDCNLYDSVQSVSQHASSGQCASPAALAGQSIFNISIYGTECHAARVVATSQSVWAHVHAALLLDCGLRGDLPVNVSWWWRNEQLVSGVINDTSPTFQHIDSYSNSSIVLLANGSLYIPAVTRRHSGHYTCFVRNIFGNASSLVTVRLNYNSILSATLESIIVGLICSAAFFLIAVVIGAVRYLAHVCSSKEKRKRKSIHEVLDAIQDYKCAQFDRFSAYRTQKMDQLSALKSATIGQLSAFRNARVDRLRIYKQATIASILAHLERMREHYAAQTARIKENCTQQAERLRENYGNLKDYRCQQVDKMKESYAVQASRIRDYGLQQMSRLREQYKTQQQHVLKLVELLDVGSCVSGVIEAECMKAESMIFDADIAFDFEAQPVHAAVDCGSSHADNVSNDSSSEYLTASDSDLASSVKVCVVAISEPVREQNSPSNSSIANSTALADSDAGVPPTAGKPDSGISVDGSTSDSGGVENGCNTRTTSTATDADHKNCKSDIPDPGEKPLEGDLNKTRGSGSGQLEVELTELSDGGQPVADTLEHVTVTTTTC